MFEMTAIEADNKQEYYEQIAGFARGLMHGESDAIANAANFVSLLYHSLPDVNWVGFAFRLAREFAGRLPRRTGRNALRTWMHFPVTYPAMAIPDQKLSCRCFVMAQCLAYWISTALSRTDSTPRIRKV